MLGLCYPTPSAKKRLLPNNLLFSLSFIALLFCARSTMRLTLHAMADIGFVVHLSCQSEAAEYPPKWSPCVESAANVHWNTPGHPTSFFTGIHKRLIIFQFLLLSLFCSFFQWHSTFGLRLVTVISSGNFDFFASLPPFSNPSLCFESFYQGFLLFRSVLIL